MLIYFILCSCQLYISLIYSEELAKLCPADLQGVPSRVTHSASRRGRVLTEKKILNNQHVFMNIPMVQSVM